MKQKYEDCPTSIILGVTPDLKINLLIFIGGDSDLGIAPFEIYEFDPHEIPAVIRFLRRSQALTPSPALKDAYEGAMQALKQDEVVIMIHEFIRNPTGEGRMQ